jgi:hypothetical protein
MSKNAHAKNGRSTRTSQRITAEAAGLSNASAGTEIQREQTFPGQNEIVLPGEQQVETGVVPERPERRGPLGDITVIH